jgi:hypothetical protein
MDNTKLVSEVSELFSISGYSVKTSVKVNHREIDIYAEELQNLIRKIVLIECADYERPVGIDKLQTDFNKLSAAKEHLTGRAVIMHVSRNGYTPEAYGYALDSGVDVFSIAELRSRLVNFSEYIDAIANDKSKQAILKEYQPNRMHFEGHKRSTASSMQFLDDWIDGDSHWLTVLGDYGVGKSWTLKRFLYHRIDIYNSDPGNNLLPFFIPLQNFTKSFDFQNLILRCFQNYGIGGVHYKAFEYLMGKGRILFLLDSFDEMAQHLNRSDIRSNLNELLSGISRNSKAIMTTRPNYFEGRAERLLVVEKDGHIEWHPLDEKNHQSLTALALNLKEQLESVQFSRIQDLTNTQRLKLFATVLGEHSESYKRLISLFERFQNLESISQKAVIARLLTTVATTISENTETVTIDGYPLIPDELSILNEAKIFEIVLYNLLHRDQGIGTLSAGQRLFWLRQFSLYLQRKDGLFFAGPEEVRSLIEILFKSELRRSDTPEQVLEGYYRTCRRHSGLTTEGQFKDTSGMVDMPVDANDSDSNVGFSHNSLREFMVAEALADHLVNDKTYFYMENLIISDVICDFFSGLCEFRKDLIKSLRDKYDRCDSATLREIYFRLIYGLFRKNSEHLEMLGKPVLIDGMDLSDFDFSGLNLSNSNIRDCIAFGTDFRKSDLRNANFSNCILEQVTLDGAVIGGLDLTTSEVVSIYVFDELEKKTTAIIYNSDALQWLYTHGARVKDYATLNPFLGQAWYEAAREVTKTIERRIAGSHQDVSLSKGTKSENRKFAQEFVTFLKKRKILVHITKSNTGPGDVVKLDPTYRNDIMEFSTNGKISTNLAPFFNKYLPADFKGREGIFSHDGIGGNS